MDRLAKIGNVLGLIFLYYVIAGQILAFVIWAEGGVIMYLEGINQHWLGSILFLTLSYILNIYLLYSIIAKVRRKDWEKLTTKKVTYRVEDLTLDHKKHLKLHFDFIYLLKNKIYTKKYTMLQKKELIPKIKHYLDKNLQDEKVEAIIYYNPENETQSAVNYGIAKTDWVFAPFLIGLLLTLLGSSLAIVNSKLNVSAGLLTPLLVLLVFTECLLLISYIPALFIGKKLAGVHDHVGYPLFYNPLSKEEFDLIKNVREIDKICMNCGGAISKNDQFCSVCGTNLQVQDNFSIWNIV